jgi:hypothetical protein
MHLHCNFITLAESVGDAKSNVNCFIDEYAGRYFFDYGGLEEPDEPVVLLDEIREQLEADKAEVDKLLPKIEEEIKVCKIKGHKSMEGYHHKRYGRILDEDLTSDMPFFNIENWDWSLPVEVPEESESNNWYAVRVDLHC